MRITEYRPEQIDELQSIWQQLETGPDMTIFQSYDWYKWINSFYSKEKTKNHFRKWVYLVCSDENDKPVMIAPIQIIKFGRSVKGVGLDKGAYFIGRKGYTDYLSLIYYSFSKDAVLSIFDYLRDVFGIKRFFFEKIRVESSLYKSISSDYPISITKKGVYAALVLPKDFDAYKGTLKRHAKQNIRTAINRQKRDELHLKHEVIYDIDLELQKQLWAIRAQRLKEKDRKSVTKITSRVYNWLRNRFVVVFNAKTNVFDCSSPQWALLVKKENRVIGFYWGIRDLQRSIYYVILAGVDKEFTWYSPSISHMYLWIQELYDANNQNIKVIDFTLGDERYKTDIGGEVQYFTNFTISL